MVLVRSMDGTKVRWVLRQWPAGPQFLWGEERVRQGGEETGRGRGEQEWGRERRRRSRSVAEQNWQCPVEQGDRTFCAEGITAAFLTTSRLVCTARPAKCVKFERHSVEHGWQTSHWPCISNWAAAVMSQGTRGISRRLQHTQRIDWWCGKCTYFLCLDFYDSGKTLLCWKSESCTFAVGSLWLSSITLADTSSHWIIGFLFTFSFNSSLIRPTSSSLGLLVRRVFGALFSVSFFFCN